MRINNIGFEGINHRKLKLEYLSNVGSPIAQPATSLNNMPSASLGKSLVSFKAKPFEQTVDENYFQLPINKETNLPFEADEYQLNAAKAIYNGEDHLVTAPTGMGKTAIAKYSITKNMSEGKRTFYTTPLKALSDQKYREFQDVYGKDNVGLLTGDIKVNPKAPIVVMTTEIYHNMAFAEKFKKSTGDLDSVKTVIFDELHYMGDFTRGHIWEQSIALSPKNVQLLSLSATIGNDDEIIAWQSKIRGNECSLTHVPSEKRHVPLKYSITDIDSKSSKVDFASCLKKVEQLKRDDKLPALFFDYSKKDCRNMIAMFKEEGVCLNTPKEMDEVQSIIQLYQKEGKYLGESLDKVSLMRGFAIHNAGILPTQKELVEELCQKKLLKVTMATGTLEAGINMPVRTVVFTSIRKPDYKFADGADGKRDLTVNEFHQSGGRAGRRGIDTIGYVDVMSSSSHTKNKVMNLINSSPDAIVSRYNPDFSSIVNYYDNSLTDDNIKELLSKSFQVYDKNPEKSAEKTENLLKEFMKRKSVLQDFGYINKDNTITEKSRLLSRLNGYEQIPIIDMIHGKKLFALTPSELAAGVGSMSVANEQTADRMEQNEKFKSMRSRGKESLDVDVIKTESKPLNWFLDSFDDQLREYNIKRYKDPQYHKVAQNREVALHIYDWAELNKLNEDSVSNWRKMCQKYIAGMSDEGGLFREITQTNDLLKQISEVAKIGLERATTDNGKQYYEYLMNTAKEAVKLLSKKPII